MRAMRSQAKVNTTDLRSEPRVPLGRSGTLRSENRSQLVIRIADLTRDGCRIETDETLLPDEQITIGIAGVGSVEARVVRRSATGYGCVFMTSLPRGRVSAAFEENVVTLPVGANPIAPDSVATGTTDADRASDVRRVGPSPRSTMTIIAAVSIAGWALLIWGFTAF